MFWKKWFKKKVEKQESELDFYDQMEKDLVKQSKQMEKARKVATLKKSIDYQAQVQELELEKLRLEIEERRASLRDYDDEEEDDDMNKFMQMLNMAQSSGVLKTNSNTQETDMSMSNSRTPEDFSQTNDFIRTINELPIDKFNKLKTLVTRL